MVQGERSCRFSGRSEKGLERLIVLDSGFSVGKRLPPDSAVRGSCSFSHAYVTPVTPLFCLTSDSADIQGHFVSSLCSLPEPVRKYSTALSFDLRRAVSKYVKPRFRCGRHIEGILWEHDY